MGQLFYFIQILFSIMLRIINFYILLHLLMALCLAKNFNNYWNNKNRDPNDDRIETMETTVGLLKSKTIPIKRNNVVLGSLSCADSHRCGCYKGYCWAYLDENQTSATGWWCFTQREGIRGMQKAWAKCTNSTQCSWSMTCGDCWTWVGRKTGIKTDKLLC